MPPAKIPAINIMKSRHSLEYRSNNLSCFVNKIALEIPICF